MTGFELIPYVASTSISSLTGSVSLSSGQILLSFDIEGDLSRFQWPQRVKNPARKPDLWRQTCFELFISHPRDAGYCEFNFSPSGHWHCFCFIGYRTGMKTCGKIVLVSDRVLRASDRVSIELKLAYSNPASENQDLQVGISAILMDHAGQYHYYSLCHDAATPDFHLLQSRILRLS